MLHALEFAGLRIPNNVFLAPMAGYTNEPFRRMCSALGAGLTFTEMVSAKGLMFGSEETKRLLLFDGRPRAAQIFGSDPDVMRRACESEELAPFDLIDINMGCPMPKIIRNGDGSALMEDPARAEAVIKACVKSGKRVSVKFRSGLREGDRMAAEFAKLCEGAGACLITVHGRTRDRIYAGPVDWEQIAAAKAAVSIPVIANGGVWSEGDCLNLLEETGADGVMIARAALYRPQIFAELTGKEPPPMSELFSEQLARTRALYGDRFACAFMRKMAAFYIKGRRDAAAMKRTLFAADTADEVARLGEEIFGAEE